MFLMLNLFPWQGGHQCSMRLLIKLWMQHEPVTTAWSEAVFDTQFTHHSYITRAVD